MRFEPRRALTFLTVAGLAGAVLFIPTIAFIGGMLSPSRMEPATAQVPPAIGDAIWARVNGGRATQLLPLNPFTLGRTFSCMIWAERHARPERDAHQRDCMEHLPAIDGLAIVSSVQMRADGVWQDARVPFVQIGHMSRASQSWSKADVINTVAERAEFQHGWQGIDQASQGYFGRAAAELTLPQVGLLAAKINNPHFDPWCHPAEAAARRRDVLDLMRRNGAIDDAAFEAANASDLGLGTPPPTHQPCK